MGDLVLSLPTDQMASLSGAEVDWWIPKGLGFVAQYSDPPRRSVEIARTIGFRQWFQLLFFLNRKRYDAALVFHAPWWVNALLWMARIPIRVGNKSQWHSYLFLNRGLRQRRSQVVMHELDYNYQLARQVFEGEPSTLHLKLTYPKAIDPEKRALLPHHYIVIHPGMGGSALNWPTSHYQELIEKISHTSEVVITGTKADADYLAPLKLAFQNSPRIKFLDGAFSGEELLWVLHGAAAVLAPSTGVLHLAASLGVPTLGLFSPIKVESIDRWGPRGDRVKAIAPPQSQITDQGQSMNLIDPVSIYNELTKIQVLQKSSTD
jgi:heptosyltransferase I